MWAPHQLADRSFGHAAFPRNARHLEECRRRDQMWIKPGRRTTLRDRLARALAGVSFFAASTAAWTASISFLFVGPEVGARGNSRASYPVPAAEGRERK
jgi:hypothetical protein